MYVSVEIHVYLNRYIFFMLFYGTFRWLPYKDTSVLNSAAVTTERVHVCFLISSPDAFPGGVGLLDIMVAVFLVFLKNLHSG